MVRERWALLSRRVGLGAAGRGWMMRSGLVGQSSIVAVLLFASGCATPAGTGIQLVDGAEGITVVECRVQANGRLDQCLVVSETPAGEGWGEEALEAAERFRMNTVDRHGQSTVGSRVRISMTWRQDDDAPVAAEDLDLPPPEA